MSDNKFTMKEFDAMSDTKDMVNYIWDHTVKYIDVTDEKIEVRETLELDCGRQVTLYARRTDLDSMCSADDEDLWLNATYKFEFEEDE